MQPCDALSLADTARLIGRSSDWLGRHHARLNKDYKFPRPILPTAPLHWDAAQLAAWMDRDLPTRLRDQAAAMRAARDAYAGAKDAGTIGASRAALDEKFGLNR